MSSWKKTAKSTQKTHKERHQPQFRKNLGLLEKKKDYITRAKDYNEKKATIKLLRKRALNKNPDEFYFHMISSQTANGINHENKINKEYSIEQIKLMKTQDLKYITYKCNLETKKVEKLHSNLHMIDAAKKIKNKHLFFVDDNNDMKDFNLVKKFNTHPALLNRRINRPKLDSLQIIKLPDFDELTFKQIEQQKYMVYKELCKRIDRERELTIVQQTLEMKKTLKDKKLTKPTKIQSGSTDCAPIYKWKFERKR